MELLKSFLKSNTKKEKEMKNHKVIDIKITYDPELLSDEEELDKKIKDFLDDLNSHEGVTIRAKRHKVELDYMPDEYGLE